MNWNLSDPAVLKIIGGAALYLLGGGRTAKLGGLALAGWGAWQYASAPKGMAPLMSPQQPSLPSSSAASGELAPMPNFVHG